MDKTTSSRDEVYKSAPDAVKDLYSSEDTGESLWNAATQIGIDGGPDYRNFALAVGDVILGLYKKSSLAQLLKDRVGLDQNQIDIVLQNLKELLDKIQENTSVPNAPIIITPDPTITTENKQPEDISSKSAGLQPLRTFAMDVDVSRAHGYGAFRSGEDNEGDEPVHHSSQDDIIKK